VTILFFLHPGTNSRAQFIDMIKGFEARGHRTLIWEMGEALQVLQTKPQIANQLRASVSQQITTLIREQSVDLSVGMWANAISVTENQIINQRSVTLFERIQSPHLLIWLDSPERAHGNSLRTAFKSEFFNSQYLFHFINNTATAREMEIAYRFSNVLPRHYGVNTDIFKPYHDEPKEFDLIFNSNFGNWDNAPAWVLDELSKDVPDLLKLRRGVADIQKPDRVSLLERFPAPLHAGMGGLIERLTELQLTHRDRPMIDRVQSMCAEPGQVGLAAHVLMEEPQHFATVTNQLRQIEVFERAFVFVYLSRYFKCGLFGNIDYSSMGCTAKSLGAVGYEEQARVYNRGHLGLSVMRWQDEAGFHVKPYEMTASGVACVAAHREGTQHLFEDGKEIVTFRTLPEARQKIRTLLDNPTQRETIAIAGRLRTLRDHTWATWADDMIAGVRERVANPATTRHAA
jgi:spore maturation protein CgeB